jgi:hypothetical protein
MTLTYYFIRQIVANNIYIARPYLYTHASHSDLCESVYAGEDGDGLLNSVRII